MGIVMIRVQAKCWRENFLKLFPLAQVHMNTAWQTSVKAADCSHDIDALEVLWTVLFEDWCVLHGILVGNWCTIDVSYAAIPRRRGIGMVVSDLAVLDDHVMGKYTAHSFMEATANSLLWHRELAPRLGMTSTYLGKRFIHAM